MRKRFVRQDSKRYSKIGKNRKKLQKWRKPKGRDSKMRLRRKSYPRTVSTGYKNKKSESGKINGKLPILVHNLSDLKKVGKNNSVILSSRVGAKKKIEIIKVANEKNMLILNILTKEKR